MIPPEHGPKRPEGAGNGSGIFIGSYCRSVRMVPKCRIPNQPTTGTLGLIVRPPQQGRAERPQSSSRRIDATGTVADWLGLEPSSRREWWTPITQPHRRWLGGGDPPRSWLAPFTLQCGRDGKRWSVRDGCDPHKAEHGDACTYGAPGSPHAHDVEGCMGR